MSLSGARVLITGGAGLIGSAIARRLVSLDAEVTVIDSLLPQFGGTLHNLQPKSDRLKIVVADIREERSLDSLTADVDLVFSMAAQTSHLDSMHEPFTDLDINVRAQLSILEAVRHRSPRAKIVFASTRQIYGRPTSLPVPETHPIHPVDVNGINKLASEWYHRLYNEVYGLRTCVLRLTNTYGPGMRIRDARQTFVGIWLRRLLAGEPFEVWGGEQLRDFNHVDDVVDACLLVAESDEADGRVFNLGSREVVSLRQLADLLVELNGGGSFALKSFPEERKRIDIGDYYSDFSAIEKALGWRPKVPLREGLGQTIAYFREHLEHYL